MTRARPAAVRLGRAIVYPDSLWEPSPAPPRPAAETPRPALASELALHARAAAILRAAAARGEHRPDRG